MSFALACTQAQTHTPSNIQKTYTDTQNSTRRFKRSKPAYVSHNREENLDFFMG